MLSGVDSIDVIVVGEVVDHRLKLHLLPIRAQYFNSVSGSARTSSPLKIHSEKRDRGWLAAIEFELGADALGNSGYELVACILRDPGFIQGNADAIGRQCRRTKHVVRTLGKTLRIPFLTIGRANLPLRDKRV